MCKIQNAININKLIIFYVFIMLRQEHILQRIPSENTPLSDICSRCSAWNIWYQSKTNTVQLIFGACITGSFNIHPPFSIARWVDNEFGKSNPLKFKYSYALLWLVERTRIDQQAYKKKTYTNNNQCGCIRSRNMVRDVVERILVLHPTSGMHMLV